MASLFTDLQQVYLDPGSSSKFNLHTKATGNAKGLYCRPKDPANLNVLLAEASNIKIGNAFYNTKNIVAAGAITNVSTDGELTIDIDTVVGTIITETILLYAYDNSGTFAVGYKSSDASEFTPGDPNTYNVDFPIAEISTTSGMTQIISTDIVDVRNRLSGGANIIPYDVYGYCTNQNSSSVTAGNNAIIDVCETLYQNRYQFQVVYNHGSATPKSFLVKVDTFDSMRVVDIIRFTTDNIAYKGVVATDDGKWFVIGEIASTNYTIHIFEFDPSDMSLNANKTLNSQLAVGGSLRMYVNSFTKTNDIFITCSTLGAVDLVVHKIDSTLSTSSYIKIYRTGPSYVHASSITKESSYFTIFCNDLMSAYRLNYNLSLLLSKSHASLGSTSGNKTFSISNGVIGSYYAAACNDYLLLYKNDLTEIKHYNITGASVGALVFNGEYVFSVSTNIAESCIYKFSSDLSTQKKYVINPNYLPSSYYDKFKYVGNELLYLRMYSGSGSDGSSFPIGIKNFPTTTTSSIPFIYKVTVSTPTISFTTVSTSTITPTTTPGTQTPGTFSVTPPTNDYFDYTRSPVGLIVI